METPRGVPAPRDPAAPLAGASIVVGVCGGIAAYKAAELVRLFDKAGANVRVMMTPRAQAFVGPLTFQALTRAPVFTDLFDLTEEATIGHIQLADRADLVVIAPATADVIARLVGGMADDVVTAVCLATRARVLLAPSMNVNMWQHPVTQANLRRLIDVAGHAVVGPGDGFLACRWTGPGRLAEPADIVEAAALLLSPQDLAGKRVVVDAGPTHEPIDPVRFVGNRSSGKMGFAIAAAARRRGADVTLIAGPTALPDPVGVAVERVDTATAMKAAVDRAVAGADVAILAAAVADYRPAKPARQKLKKTTLGDAPSIALVPNPDILADLGARRRGGTPVLVGFAAETGDLVAEARKKLAAKRCDLIVANDVSQPDAGFAVDTNRVVLVSASDAEALPLADKTVVAHRILDRAVEILASPTGSRRRPDPKPRRPAAGAVRRRRRSP
jgi:phosphopantothenoylcysteine decarboxylase/phosphopantothenate--cysteine ligase